MVSYSDNQYTNGYQFELKFVGGNKGSTDPLGWNSIAIYDTSSLGKEQKQLNDQYVFLWNPRKHNPSDQLREISATFYVARFEGEDRVEHG